MIGVYNQDHRDSEARGLSKGRKEGRQEGRKEGRQEGRKERDFEIAKLMLQRNEAVDKVMDYTGLSRSEVEVINAEL